MMLPHNPLIDETIKNVDAIEKPATRLIIWLLIVAIIALVTVVIVLANRDSGNTGELKARILVLDKKIDNLNASFEQRDYQWQQRVDAANERFDSVQSLRYDESQATIDNYKALLKLAGSVKTKIKNLKKR